MSKSLSDNHFTYKTMTFTGQGQVSAIPDIAVIRLGAQTTGDNLVILQAENAKKIQAILQSLKQIGITDVKTFSYSIDKNYEYENGKQIDKGYNVRNILEIKTNNVEQVGIAIDTSVNFGANVVELISFDVSNLDYYYQNALNLALLNATQKAKTIALNLGVKTEPTPINIVENSMLPIPMQKFQREFASTPIVPGNLQIEAVLTVEFIY